MESDGPQIANVKYQDRLKTFETWPASNIVKPENLAQAGFYYLKSEDKTQCAFCHGVIGEWAIGDDPYTEHQRHFPSCPFVQRILRPHGKQQPLHPPELDYHNLEDLGIQQHRAPEYPQYVTYESRLETFEGWPKHIVQKPETLAEAGFAYTGIRDSVRCFSCGRGLEKWMPEDDPWAEHAKYYPDCSHVILVKGQDFIRECREDKQPLHGNAESNGEYRKSTHQNDKAAAAGAASSFSTNGGAFSMNNVNLCKICMVNEVGVVFLPCGHLVACANCAANLKDCPICKALIKATVKTFLS